MIKNIKEMGGIVKAFDPVANDSMKIIFLISLTKILGKKLVKMQMV